MGWDYEMRYPEVLVYSSRWGVLEKWGSLEGIRVPNPSQEEAVLFGAREGHCPLAPRAPTFPYSSTEPQMVTQGGRISILLELTKPSSSQYPLPSTA